MYQVRMTRSFGKDAERCKKRGYDMQNDEELTLLFTGTGTHSDIFG